MKILNDKKFTKKIEDEKSTKDMELKLPGLLYQGASRSLSSLRNAFNIHQANDNSVLCKYTPNRNDWYWIVLQDLTYLEYPDYKGKIKKYSQRDKC